MYPLTGDESLLERYYQKTNGDCARWARLFHHVGLSVKNLDDALKNRAIAFFEWRLTAGEPTELRKFTYWLKAECLEPEWRLAAYSRILDVPVAPDADVFAELDALHTMLPTHTEKVVECFAKITDRLKNDTIDIQTEEAKPILNAGLESSDEHVRANAERARENLLRAGRFDFLDMNN